MMRKAMLWEKCPGDKARCFLCAHNCLISEGDYGVCGVRQYRDGVLVTYSFGQVVANHLDTVEKKPLYHFLPGTYTYSIAAMGCNFTCSYCQNWRISTLSDSNGDTGGYEMKPEEIVREAVKTGAKSVSYTYTEPTVFYEYARETSIKAREKGLRNIFVSNGYMTSKAIGDMATFLDAANIDLKFFNDETYRRICGASLEPVLAAITGMKEAGIWVEVTTLVVPGLNDSETELRKIADFLCRLDPTIPWHVSAFHPDHKLKGVPATSSAELDRAENIGKEQGLRYVYKGNTIASNKTVCSGCGKVLLSRDVSGVKIFDVDLSSGRCSACGAVVHGVWV
jgi:pyruvate formate lyase activating enzyme